MRLFLLRHGIAEEFSPSMRDADRSLTREGRAELKSIAEGMRRMLFCPVRSYGHARRPRRWRP